MSAWFSSDPHSALGLSPFPDLYSNLWSWEISSPICLELSRAEVVLVA